MRDVRFESQPPGAEVHVDGRPAGHTPLELELKAETSHAVEIRKTGYETQSLMISNRLSAGWVVLDIALGLWPGLIDLATGAWFTLDRDEVNATLTAATTPVLAQAPSVNQTRAKLKHVGVKCAAMPLHTMGLDENLAAVIDEIFLSELQQAGFEAIGPEDINAMIGFEKTKEAVGCDDATCIAEIGGALGVDYLTAGKIAIVGGQPIVTLKLMDVNKGRVLARTNKTGPEGEKALPATLGAAVGEMVVRSGL
ncbi:MAG: hypothetical protein A2289_21395 [Deltaproteobacteria bacterium RIFOXYA12_FULL_58_15]|nr:MAG: hypothetical protein A2289_21395 [Deltaproteobacteria bacterium RIFOXYA12_FULL_58_15]OGR09725.1 MAG: hypothetical protein A2341_12980 [Deltaproteobacteria bacterium RIFOXYB12_FULL_58_9]